MPSRASVPGDGAGPSRSASTIVASTASGYHVLKIDGYSRTMGVANGDHLKSSSFHVGGYDWHLKYYPNGDHSETADSISLHLSLERPPAASAVKAQQKMSLLDRAGEPVPSYTHTSGIDTFSGKNPSWGYRSFITREALEKSKHLNDDSFSVRCDITVVTEFRTEEAMAAGNPFVVVPPPDWPQHFGDLLLSGRGADVTFRVGGETFVAHRCVLAARSSVFSAELLGSMKESAAEHCVRIDDMRADVFRNLLLYAYTDSVPEMEGREEAAVAQHLLEAADRYGMERLKLICEDRLCRRIDVGTAATTLALADQHHCHGLKAACFEFLRSRKNLDAVMRTDGCEHLARSCPSVLFEFMSKLAAP